MATSLDEWLPDEFRVTEEAVEIAETKEFEAPAVPTKPKAPAS